MDGIFLSLWKIFFKDSMLLTKIQFTTHIYAFTWCCIIFKYDPHAPWFFFIVTTPISQIDNWPY